jgi:two-component system, NtrC family, sensor histidine kinase PilS
MSTANAAPTTRAAEVPSAAPGKSPDESAAAVDAGSRWFHPHIPVDRRATQRPQTWSLDEDSTTLPPSDAALLAATRKGPADRAEFANAARAKAGLASETDVAAALTSEASLRIYRLFVVARAALGAAIATGQVVAGALGAWAAAPVLLLVFLQAIAAMLAWLMPSTLDVRDPGSWRGMKRRVWWTTIGLDLACFGGLHVLAPSGGPNYGALLLLPVLMAGVFMPRGAAVAVAGGVTALLVAVAGVTQAHSADFSTSLAQSGLAGMGLLLAAWLASELTARLQREEVAARGSQERARQEAQLNRLVIDEMRDGVMVVDRHGWVRRANPAARALIAATGGGPEPPFQLRGVLAWQDLATGIESGFGTSAGAESAQDVVLNFEPGYRRTLRMRPRFTLRRGGRGRAAEELCVLFLEDLRDVQARSRQERLAAMGRVSAGIAHEIRNPLAAISQANALLLEDASDPSQQRLARMVADNVDRLKRIVEDVLEVTPSRDEVPTPIDARGVVERVAQDWARTNQVSEGVGGVLQVELPYGPLGVLFDTEHLRRVVVNLLDNAYRHASRQAGSVRVRLYARGVADAALLVVNDGDTIAPDVERHLFEPFFSTRSRGTGLGLYICRELCGRHGARIDYRQRAASEGGRNEFHVVMRRGELSASVNLA